MTAEMTAALAGAVVGGTLAGVATLGGSIIMNRWQLKRQSRIDIWDGILPQLSSQWMTYKVRRDLDVKTDTTTTLQPRPDLAEPLSALNRKAVLIGRKDTRKVKWLDAAFRDFQLRHMEAEDARRGWPKHDDTPAPDVVEKKLINAEQEFHRLLYAYHDRMEQKVDRFWLSPSRRRRLHAAIRSARRRSDDRKPASGDGGTGHSPKSE